MQQATIFDITEKPRRIRVPKKDAQTESFDRCRNKYEAPILAFFVERGIGALFHGNDLVKFVMERVNGDYESPKRIMRGLNEDKTIGYETVCQPKSLYRITKLPEAERMAA